MSGRVQIIGDGYGWATDADVRDLCRVWSHFGLSGQPSRWPTSRKVFYANRYKLLKAGKIGLVPRRFVGLNYFHGNPEVDAKFKEMLAALKARQRFIHRVRVSHSSMMSRLEEEGFSGRTRQIPIPVDLERFSPIRRADVAKLRKVYKVPTQATVIGNFQKDGLGWGSGTVPKIEKGPDILVKALSILNDSIPNLFVLLAGPGRDFVKAGLCEAGVDFAHLPNLPADAIPDLYRCLDAYVISSRDEGGPKGLLEAMASGIPVATTPVGQAIDLAIDGQNAWKADSFESDRLSEKCLKALESTSDSLLKNALATAQQNSIQSQIGLWREFFSGTGVLE